MRIVFVSVLAVVLLSAASTALAQQEDDQTEEQRRRDEAYLERYRQTQDEPAKPRVEPADVARLYVERADELIRDRNHRSAQAEHYRVQTDDPRVDVAAAAGLLESFRAFFVAGWSRAAGPAEQGPTPVYLFYSYYKYNQLVSGDWSRELLRPKGHYGSELGALAIHTDSDPPGALANTLVHEAAHQLIDTRLYPTDRRPATWIAEGLATYYENTLMDAEGFRAGRIGGKRVVLRRDVDERPASDANAQLRLVKTALRHAGETGEPLAVTILSADEPSEFYRDDVETMYAASWVLIHYLLHGDDGRHAESLGRYIALDAEGRASDRELFAELGLDGAGLDEALGRYVKTLRAR